METFRVDTEFLLTQWAMWAYENRGLSIGYPSIEPFTRMRPRSAKGLVIDDDEGRSMDRIVSLLKVSDHREHEALARVYLAGQSYRVAAKEMGLNHNQVSNLVQGGKRYIEGMLEIRALAGG